MKTLPLKTLWVLPVIICGVWLGAASQAHEDAAPTRRLTNPLLRVMRFKELVPFKEKIEKTVAAEKALGNAEGVGVYFRSFGDGIWHGINEREEFCPASLLKVPVMIAYFKLAESDPKILEKKIKYDDVDLKGFQQGIVPTQRGQKGRVYTVDELIRMMIVESDNTANKLLIDHLPPGVFRQTFDDFGIDTTRHTADEDFVSLKVVVHFLRTLYNASYLNEEYSEKALAYLTQVAFPDGIRAGVPASVTVAHKFGERFFESTGKKQLHEIAIVYHANNPYLLAVMTKGTDYSKMANCIKKISAVIYEEIDSQYR